MEHGGDEGEGGDHTCPINARVGRVNGSCQTVLTENIKNQPSFTRQRLHTAQYLQTTKKGY